MRFSDESKVTAFVVIEGTEPNAEVTPKPPASPVSEAERIRAARERGIAHSKAYNRFENYGPLHDERYWVDFAGECTSHYDADTLISLLGFLNVDGFENVVPLAQAGNVLAFNTYSRNRGAWKRGDQIVSIQEIRQIVDERIRELGLSKAAIFEYMTEPHLLEEDCAFHALSFDERMAKFREGNPQ